MGRKLWENDEKENDWIFKNIKENASKEDELKENNENDVK